MDAALFWSPEMGRFTFYNLHKEKGMSNFSTMEYEDTGRKEAARLVSTRIPWEPTFVNPQQAARCCGSKGANYRLQCRQAACFVKCPNLACDGGKLGPNTVVQMCDRCPAALALPNRLRMPSVCPCGVRLWFVISTCALLASVIFCQAAFGNFVCWTESQHRLLSHNGGCFRRVGALVCVNFTNCSIRFTFGEDNSDLFVEDTFAHSSQVP